MINTSIIGANGYTGLELLNILSGHPDVALKNLVSVSNAGTKITDMYPSLIKLFGRTFDTLDTGAIADSSDVVFSCLPHTSSAKICGELHAKGVKIIDLSADFRYKNLDIYQNTYKVTHPCPELLPKAVYGLPELYKDDIARASIVGNPGCYTTCSILPLYPLLKKKLIDADNIVIDAKSGVSGAGKKADVANLFSEINESFKAYSVTNHRHTSEIEQELSIAAGRGLQLSFTPHLLPITRGILSTIHLKLTRGASADDIYAAYSKYYEDKPFVVIQKNGLPSINHVKHGNYIMIGFAVDARLNRLIVISCLDNLVKGASGQAVQNMNIMFGLDETAGLDFAPRYI